MSNSTRGASSAKSLPFFSLNAHYLIEPDTKSGSLAIDACCFLESCTAAIQVVIEGIGDNESQMAANPKDAVALLFGVLYQLQMVQNIAGALQYTEVRS